MKKCYGIFQLVGYIDRASYIKNMLILTAFIFVGAIPVGLAFIQSEALGYIAAFFIFLPLTILWNCNVAKRNADIYAGKYYWETFFGLMIAGFVAPFIHGVSLAALLYAVISAFQSENLSSSDDSKEGKEKKGAFGSDVFSSIGKQIKSTMSRSDHEDKLGKLFELKEKGALTEEEFLEQKRRILKDVA